jgi:chromosome segregation ATPase
VKKRVILFLFLTLFLGQPKTVHPISDTVKFLACATTLGGGIAGAYFCNKKIGEIEEQLETASDIYEREELKSQKSLYSKLKMASLLAAGAGAAAMAFFAANKIWSENKNENDHHKEQLLREKEESLNEAKTKMAELKLDLDLANKCKKSREKTIKQLELEIKGNRKLIQWHEQCYKRKNKQSDEDLKKVNSLREKNRSLQKTLKDVKNQLSVANNELQPMNIKEKQFNMYLTNLGKLNTVLSRQLSALSLEMNNVTNQMNLKNECCESLGKMVKELEQRKQRKSELKLIVNDHLDGEKLSNKQIDLKLIKNCLDSGKLIDEKIEKLCSTMIKRQKTIGTNFVKFDKKLREKTVELEK